MVDAVASSMGIVAYLALFATVGVLFLFVNLLVGWFLRPSNPHQEKLEIYECGEPTIGSSFVQFDLRFYVVALLFIIFDVEVAFFFPWATVFGKSTHLMDEREANQVVMRTTDGDLALTEHARNLYRELGVRDPQVPTAPVPASLQNAVRPTDDDAQMDAATATAVIKKGSRQLALITIIDIGAFFAILLVGFAYVWKRGDLDWVRAVTRRDGQQSVTPSDAARSEPQPALSASAPGSA